MTPKAVPREKIPWFPVVAAELCNGCGKCLDFCPHGVYARDSGSSAVIVQNPFECVVGCNNCENLCPEKAISFPDLEAITEIIRRLREEAAPDLH
ncbi:MAG: 4Fe-4S binding protein [Acidobacteriota bacterium]|nr:4Fe-4S binding protein [Acidobacteriota bacterium]